MLGGRNVYILSQRYTDPTSTAGKVAIVFFSVLIFPVAAVSIASLLLKLATVPWIWEKKLIKVQTEQTWNAINAFNQAYDEGNYNEAIVNLKNRPEIEMRQEVDQKLFTIINRKINNIDPWEEIQDLLPHMSITDGITLIDHMVKMRLKHEVENDRFSMHGDQIFRFIIKSLRCKDLKFIEQCCKKLLAGSLQIKPQEDVIPNAVKLDILHKLINLLTNLKSSKCENELDRKICNLMKYQLKQSAFPESETFINPYYSMLNDDSDMEIISSAVHKLRKVCQAQQFLDSIKELSESPDANSQSLKTQYVKFENFLSELSCISPEDDKDYYSSSAKVIESLINFKDTISKASTDKSDIETKKDQLKDVYETHSERAQEILNISQVDPYTTTPTESTVSLLRQKKIAVIYLVTEQIKSLLLKQCAIRD